MSVDSASGTLVEVASASVGTAVPPSEGSAYALLHLIWRQRGMLEYTWYNQYIRLLE